MGAPSQQRSPNVVRQPAAVTRRQRERRYGHRAVVVWLTGLPGSGKSSIARCVERTLFERGCAVVVLDGDNLRHGLCGDLGFSPEARSENLRRAAEVCRLFVEAGHVVLAAFVSPLRQDRERVRAIVGPQDFVEVFVDAPLQVCRQRDPKGLYARAERGEIRGLTGLDAPYEPPAAPALHLRTDRCTVQQAAQRIVAHLEATGRLRAP